MSRGKCPGGICPWGKYPGGTCPGGLCPRTIMYLVITIALGEQGDILMII